MNPTLLPPIISVYNWSPMIHTSSFFRLYSFNILLKFFDSGFLDSGWQITFNFLNGCNLFLVALEKIIILNPNFSNFWNNFNKMTKKGILTKGVYYDEM